MTQAALNQGANACISPDQEEVVRASIAQISDIGYRRTVETNDINPQLMEELKLTQPTIDSISEELPKIAEKTSAMLML